MRSTCSVEDCDQQVKGHGYCPKHYSRWRKHGDPQVVLTTGGRQRLSNQMEAFLTDMENVIQLYENGMFLQDIAAKYGVGRQTVANHLRSRGIQIRRRGLGLDGPTWRKLSEEHIDEIVASYETGTSSVELATKFGVSKSTIHNALRRRNATRPRPAWRSPDGYLKVWVAPDDPYAAMATKPHGRVLEHRLVMARHLGRPLLPTETVHHRNGKRDDNRLRNLELRQGKHGNGQSWRCADCGSRNLEAI